QIGTAEEILMQPADDYVERFVEDVDLSKVLTAAHIMKRAESITIDRGPRTALELMRNEGISTIFVTDKSRKLLRYITTDQAQKTVDEAIKEEDVLTQDLTTTSPDILLNDVYDNLAD